MKIGSPEHKKFQEENGQKLRARLNNTVKAGPKSSGLFDQAAFDFSRKLLNNLNDFTFNTKVKK